MVHTYSLNGYNIAIDGNSGSIHLLDDITYQILKESDEMPSLANTQEKLKKKYTENEISEAYNEIKSLIEQGMLYSSIKNIEEVVSSKQMNKGLKALCLHVSHDCNLRCEYCFASSGDYNSGRILMDKEVALKAIDYLVQNSNNRHNIEIDFLAVNP